MYKWGVDYDLPLLYPDAGFGNIVYLLRVRADLFFDNTQARDFFNNGNRFEAGFRSTGVEITFDTKWWNEGAASVGIRYSRLLDDDLFGGTGRNRWEIILPGQTLTKTYTTDYNDADENDRRLRSNDSFNLRIVWNPEKIILENGKLIE